MNAFPSSERELEDALAVVRSAAREAAALVRAGYRHRPAVEHKGAVDLVTEYDRASEALLRARLAAALPYAVIGEEAGGNAAETAFYVDPIDGTTNFVHGHPFWCVSIGLVVSGTPVLGVVNAPALGIEWFGYRSRSTKLAMRVSADGGEELCLPSAMTRFEDSLLATGFPYDRRTSSDNNFDAFVAIKRRCQAVRRCGSAALDLCLVADGTYEGYWERKLSPWDVAGGIALVLAAGGRVTDFAGGGDYMASGHTVATNGAIHAALLHELDSLVPASLRVPPPK